MEDLPILQSWIAGKKALKNVKKAVLKSGKESRE